MNTPFRYLEPDGAIVTLPRHMRLADAVLHLRRHHLRLTGQQVRSDCATLNGCQHCCQTPGHCHAAVLHLTARLH